MRNGPTHTIVTPGDNLYMAWNPADAHHIAVGCSDDILSIIDVRMASSASNIGTSTGTAGVGLVKAAKFDYEVNTKN